MYVCAQEEMQIKIYEKYKINCNKKRNDKYVFDVWYAGDFGCGFACESGAKR